jgi:hypothetical protein
VNSETCATLIKRFRNAPCQTPSTEMP